MSPQPVRPDPRRISRLFSPRGAVMRCPRSRLRTVTGPPGRWGVPLLCRVEQIAVDPQDGALPARLHQQGQLVGWDTTWLQVCMDHDRALVILRAHLVRVLDPHESGGRG